MSNTPLSFAVLSTPKPNTAQTGLNVIKGFGSPHVIKSKNTQIGKDSEWKARAILCSKGFDCIDVGEGFEFDLIATGVGFSSRVQIKTIGLDGVTRLLRSSQSVKGGYKTKPYGSDAFDHLLLIDRGSLSGYLIPASDLLVGDKMKGNVRATNFSDYFISI